MAAIIWGLTRRLRIPTLTKRYDNTTIMGLFAGINGLIAIAVMSAVAWATRLAASTSTSFQMAVVSRTAWL